MSVENSIILPSRVGLINPYCIFLDCGTPSRGWYVDIGTVINGNPCRVWTRQFGNLAEAGGSAAKVPLVLVHGMAAGIAFFALNVGELSKDRPLYAIDLPGAL